MHTSESIISKEAISLYPNPGMHEVNIQVNNPTDHTFRAEVSDLSGKVQYIQAGIRHTDRLSISKLEQGVYIVVFINEETQNVSFTKLIKQ